MCHSDLLSKTQPPKQSSTMSLCWATNNDILENCSAEEVKTLRTVILGVGSRQGGGSWRRIMNGSRRDMLLFWLLWLASPNYNSTFFSQLRQRSEKTCLIPTNSWCDSRKSRKLTWVPHRLEYAEHYELVNTTAQTASNSKLKVYTRYQVPLVFGSIYILYFYMLLYYILYFLLEYIRANSWITTAQDKMHVPYSYGLPWVARHPFKKQILYLHVYMFIFSSAQL